MLAVSCVQDKLSVAEFVAPTPGAGEVLVDVVRAGICGSDKSAVFRASEANKLTRRLLGGDWMDRENPVVLGHEFLCRVNTYGPGTRGSIPLGTRVVAIPRLTRKSGNVDLGFAGPSQPGGYAQQMLLDERFLLPVPDGVSDDAAALTEPVCVAFHAVDRTKIAPGDVGFVLGCGPIGLSVIAVLKSLGVHPIVATDCSAARLKLASAVGADIVFKKGEGQVSTILKDAAATEDPTIMAPPTWGSGQLPQRRVVAFECSGWPGSLEELIESVPPASHVSVIGINERSDEIEPALAIMKELTLVFSSFYTEEEFSRTLRMIADGHLKVSPIVTKVIGLGEVGAMFEALETNPTEGKVLIDPSR